MDKFIAIDTSDCLCERARYEKDSQKAKELLIKAHKLDPTHKIANYNLGVLCLEQKENETAIEYFKKAIPVGHSYFHLLELYLQKCDRESAEYYFKLGSETGCMKCVMTMLRHYFNDMMETGKIDQFGSLFRAHIEYLYRYNESLYMIGEYYLKINNRESAIDAFELTEDYGPALYALYKNQLYGKCSDDILKQAANLGHEEAMYEYGCFLLENGKKEDGLKYLTNPRGKNKIFDYYSSLAENGPITQYDIKQIKTMFSSQEMLTLMKKIEKTNLSRLEPSEYLIQQCAELHLVPSRVRWIVDEICNGRYSKSLLQELLQHAIDGNVEESYLYSTSGKEYDFLDIDSGLDKV